MLIEVNAIRFALLCAVWMVALIQIVAGEHTVALSNIGVVIFVVFGLLTLPKMRRDSLIILVLLGFVAWLLLDHMPSPLEYISDLCYQEH